MPTEQAQVAQLVDRLGADRHEIVAGMVQMVLGQISDLDHDAATRSLLEASIAENVVAALNFLKQDFDADLLEAPSSALAYARVLAQRDVPQSALIRAYRIGHAQVLDHALGYLDEVPSEHRASLVVTMVRRSAQYIDQICEQVGRTYERERERWVASQGGVRQHWVNELLGAGAVDRAAAEQALRYPLDAVHVACKLWPVGRMSSFDLVTAVEDVRAHAGTVLRARATLVVPTDEHEARLWLALPASGGVRPEDLVPPQGTLLHAAIGRPGADLAGFRASARQAARVKEILATRLGSAQNKDAQARRPRWVHYVEVAPVALMAKDLGAVRDFVAVTLGELAQSGTRGDTLRETLRTFLTQHRSHAAAAQTMNLHRNSIQYRVRQATALLPDGARSLDDDFNVRVALLAAHWFGDAVLT
ncbi:CdaR family transcriptional regulator [Streptomyces sp. V3I7]|uniref:PucR family transcriptional regulator n=1 Tax=Streptomyces sp. V3I7 TaxID=3042278 RepID=UPI002780BD98|nr:helix-turn-helix domain-containing protein [Streptomyces sp. V3I7]MDQ0994592.1 DNA-binding PucR family transcriptional regulator [Streptomyces sp. V3I7]